jgi:hypothetical protein
MQQPIKEERKEKEEGRKKWKVTQGSRSCRISLGLATVFFFFFFFFFFFPVVGLAASPRRRSAQTPRGDPPRNKSTTGH